MPVRPPPDALSSGVPAFPLGVRCAVERRGPYAVVLLTGTLERESAELVRRELDAVLASRPAGLLVDLAGLRIVDPAAVRVLPAVAERAAVWPGSAVAACTADADMAKAIGVAGQRWNVPVYPDVNAALAAVGPPQEVPRLGAFLRPIVGAARQARELVTEACGRWELPELLGPACTVVTELVNNVVVHARTPMELILGRRGSRVDISVQDGSPQPPDARGPVTPMSPGGRGLVMVDAVAERWGYTLVRGGKVVWAVLRPD